MTTDEKYQEAVDGIALARRTVAQTSQVIRDAMDAGDDPVVFLHNLAGSLAKESPFQTGGQGAAVYVVACFLLAESGFFEDPDTQGTCICTGPPDGEFVATCPIHRGSWAETLEIMADRELTAELTRGLGEREDEDDPIDTEDLRAAMGDRHAAEDVAIAEEGLPAFVEALSTAAPYCSGYCSELPGIVAAAHDPRCSEYKEPCCVAHVDLECALDAPESCCAECPALGSAEPCCPNHHAQCTAVDICCCGCPELVAYCDDPDCGDPECDGDHDPLRCPTTGVVRGNIATANSRWVCCGGLYPDHQADESASSLDAMVAEEFESWERERNGGA